LYRVGAETTTGCLLAASALGKRGTQAADVGKEAAEDLLSDLSCEPCVDRHLQDQVCRVFFSNFQERV
jgi:RNA 3'-terminal phosphate cyclase (ATP)